MQVAIVDDDPIVHHLASEMLIAEGHSPVLFHSGGEFLDAIEAHETSVFPFEAVLLDCFLGDLSGAEVLEKLALTFDISSGSTRFILTSADDAEDILATLKGSSLDWCFLPKPFVAAELIGALKTKSVAQRGFTLVELVAVAALLALMSAILYGSFTSIIRAKTSIEQQRVTDRTAQLVLDRMMRELGSIPISGVPLVGHKFLSGQTVQSTRALQQYLIGNDKKMGELDSDELRFSSLAGGIPVFNNFTNYGIVEIAYRLERDTTVSGADEDNDMVMLIRDEIPAYVTDEDIVRKRRRVLAIANNILGLNFRYYFKNEWHEEWVSRRNTIPEIIEITLSVKSEAGGVEHYRTSVAVPNRA